MSDQENKSKNLSFDLYILFRFQKELMWQSAETSNSCGWPDALMISLKQTAAEEDTV